MTQFYMNRITPTDQKEQAEDGGSKLEVSYLVFYAQSAITVISGRFQTRRKYKPQRHYLAAQAAEG